MWLPTVGVGQIQDTIVTYKTDVDSPIYYSAEDSIYSDIKNQQIHLYNNAQIDNGEIQMKAGYIMIDLNKNEVYSSYIYDADSNKIQSPEFTDGAEKINAAKIRYNFTSKKGFIEEVAIKQDENYLYMEVAKRHSNEEIHFLRGRFTTCDLEEPHYHFQLSRAILIPDKRIVSGPMNLWIKGVPTPLGLPFSIIPQVEDKTHGLIFPHIVPLSSFGFGLQDLGYYIPINDRLQTTFFGSIYSRGSWGLKNVTDYAIRYKFRGNVEASYEEFKSGFPENTSRNKLRLRWNHTQDPKANPYWNFSSKVNFSSDNNSKTDLNPISDTYFSNAFNSDINLRRNFPGKPITSGLKLGISQSTTTGNFSLKSPVLNVNVTRFFPFKKVIKGSSGWKQAFAKFGVTYNFEGQNRSVFADSLLRQNNYEQIGRQFQNGIRQDITIQTIVGMFKNTWKLTPMIKYGNNINFQQTEKRYDPTLNTTINDTLHQFGMAHSLTLTGQLNTALYSYYKFIGKKEALLRHILTPSFSFQYIPNLNKSITDSVGVNMMPITYSPFERSLYRVSSVNDQALINFSFNNTFELKRKSEKDTITGYKKTRLIEALSLSGRYDLLKDSMNLSNLSLNMRVSPTRWLNFVANATLSPYDWNDTTGAILGTYALQTRKTIGRLISNHFTTTLTLTSKESREKINTDIENINGNWNSDYEYFMLHPEYIVSFDIPWKVSLSHVYTINANTSISQFSPDRWNQIQTLMLNGDVNFTKRWKLSSIMNMDLQTKKITNARFTLARNMHCWALAFHWTPIGGNKSFLFSLRSTSSLFKDAKIDIRKPPAFL